MTITLVHRSKSGCPEQDLNLNESIELWVTQLNAGLTNVFHHQL